MFKRILIIPFLLLFVFGLTGCKNNETKVIQSNKRDSSVEQIEVITDYINIRSEKSIESNILGKVYKGEIYSILSIDDDSMYKWIEICTENNIHGYISGKDEFIKIMNSVDVNETEKEQYNESDNDENINNNKQKNENKNNTTKSEENNSTNNSKKVESTSEKNTNIKDDNKSNVSNNSNANTNTKKESSKNNDTTNKNNNQESINVNDTVPETKNEEPKVKIRSISREVNTTTNNYCRITSVTTNGIAKYDGDWQVCLDITWDIIKLDDTHVCTVRENIYDDAGNRVIRNKPVSLFDGMEEGKTMKTSHCIVFPYSESKYYTIDLVDVNTVY